MTLINSLRFLCILLVLLFHAKIDFFKFGYLGVDGFFVLSGFLIGSKILWNNDYENPLDFIYRRLLRIFPLSLVVVVVTTLIFLKIYPTTLYPHLALSGFSSLSLISNFYYGSLGSYFDQTLGLMPLLHTWSLSVEIQFYIVTFLVLLISRNLKEKTKRIVILNSFFLIFVCSYFFYSQTILQRPNLSFFSPHTRIWQFALGVLLSYVLLNPVKTKIYRYIVFLGSGIVTVIGFTGCYIGADYSYIREISTIAFMWLICTLLIFEKNLLFLKLLNPYGQYAYTIYLVHYPIFLIFLTYDYSKYFYYVTICGLFFISPLVGSYTENFGRLKKNIFPFLVFILLSLGCFILIAKLGGSNKVNKQIEAYSSYVERSFKSAPDSGDVLIVGDSYAQDFFNVLQETQTIANDFRLKLSSWYVHFDCHIEIQSEVSKNKLCEQYILNSDLIEASDILIFAKNWQPGFDKHLKYILQTYPSKKIIILGSKHFGKVNLHFLSASVEGRQTIKQNKLKRIEQLNEELAKFLMAYENVTFYNPMNAFCDDKRCILSKSGRLFSYDGGHLTPSGAKVIGKHILQNYGTLQKFLMIE